ncbi:MAG: oppD [Herbaspirillum sp.]|jgi:peptide/nickel transport system ATP-binding protein|nr:oppD [Herbaspirillum sp.]
MLNQLFKPTIIGGLPEKTAGEERGGPAQPLLIVNHLTKHFPIRSQAGAGESLFGRKKKFVHAVDDINFTVAKGETLGIVGESGCGKSTTARLVAKLMAPDSGAIIFDGEGVAEFGGMEMKEFRQNLQMVFQDSHASLNPRLTIGETIAYGPRVHGVNEADAKARVHDLLARVGLEPVQYGTRYPHELSGGQRQRVNIARALAFEPRLVILDEAVAALDKSVQAQVLNLLQELKAERQLTYLFISHDLHVVHYISDRVMVMYLGQIVEIGPVDNIYGASAHPYTRALLSAVPSMDPANRTKASPLFGDPPNPIDPPAGCRFASRCPHAKLVCELHAPQLRRLIDGDNHMAACHLNDPASEHPDAVARVAA